MNIRDKVYFSYYIKENVIIFDIFEYIEQLGADTIDYMYEWGLFKDDKVVFKSKMISLFLEEKIKNDIKKVINYSNRINCSILCFLSMKSQLFLIMNQHLLLFQGPCYLTYNFSMGFVNGQ